MKHAYFSYQCIAKHQQYITLHSNTGIIETVKNSNKARDKYVRKHQFACYLLPIGNNVCTTYTHTKHFMALFQVHLGKPLSDIHPLINILLTALQYEAEHTHLYDYMWRAQVSLRQPMKFFSGCIPLLLPTYSAKEMLQGKSSSHVLFVLIFVQ